MLYEFSCNKCQSRIGVDYPIKEAPAIGSEISCECGGRAKRIISIPNLRPEFFEYDVKSLSEPVHISSRRQREKFRRDEYIKATKGTKLAGTNGKLQYSDKYMKQEMVKKQTEREKKREKSVKDTLVKARWGKK